MPSPPYNPARVDSIFRPFDADSIELWAYRGGKYYHPTYLSHRAQLFITAHHHTNDKKYLRRAEKYARKLISRCVVDSGAAYAANWFKYALHNDSSILLHPPWASGMSQGNLLMVFVRLYELTGDDEYLDFSRRLFRGFLKLKGRRETWFARLDSAGYYWIEEYPHNERPGMTLNGFVAAIYGIYDYFRVTGDSKAKTIYDMGITTIKHYLPQFRRPGQTSYYDLGHRWPATKGYHFLHVEMLRQLHLMTGDEYFKKWADILESDVPKDAT